MFDKLFFGIRMTWPKVIILALASAVVTAAFLVIPFTQNTSLANMGVTVEAWVFLALIIIMNCEKPLEAGLKTFVFFLISQPLIYLLQVPFSIQGWHLFAYYPLWLLITVLCFPGAMIAWLVKRDDLLGSLILSVATAFLAFMGVQYLSWCINDFPKHLLTVLFIAFEIVVFIFVLLKNRRGRIISSAVTLAAIIVFSIVLIFGMNGGIDTMSAYDIADEHHWTVTQVEGDIQQITVDDETGHTMIVNADKYGSSVVTLTNELGETAIYDITYERGGIVDIQPR